MIDPRKRRAFRALALFLAFCFAQLSIGSGLARPGDAATPKKTNLVTSRLTTRDDQPILVDGLSARTGATIFSGAIIQTPDKVGATITIGSFGKLDMAPNAKVKLDFDQSGNIKVTLIQGCVVLRTKPNTTGRIETAKGGAGTICAPGGELNVCSDHGVLALGTATGAGAAVGVAVGAGAAGGLSGLAIAGVALGVAIPVAVVAANRGQNGNGGTNPSSSTP